MAKIIIIDAGHGGDDSGAVGSGLQEKDLTLDLALQLKDSLSNYAEVHLTRSTDIFVSLSGRANLANQARADLFISIHINAGGGTGFESYITINPSQETQKIREIIHNEVANFYKSNEFPDRGMKTANFAVLRETNMPALLLENLFIDQKKDAQSLSSPVFRKEIARTIGQGVKKALNLTEPPQTPSSTPSKHWAQSYFDRLTKEGLVNSPHDLDSSVTWGEFSAVVSRLLDKK